MRSIAFALLFLTTGAAAKERVAVLELQTPGIEASEGKAISQNLIGILGSEASRLGYDVITTADIESMLSYEKQKDLLGCQDDTACLAELGGALGADLMIAGSVGKLGDTYNVSLTLLDIKRAEVRQRFQGSAGSPSVLATTVKRGVGVLFGTQKVESGVGTIVVRTNPPGGTVFLNGREVGKEPVTLDDIPVGAHEISAKGEGVEGKVSLDLGPNAVERVTVEMAASRLVMLKILSTPPDAAAYVDGKSVGRTPLVVQELAPGRHRVRLELDGHLTYDQEVALDLDEFERTGAPLKLDVKLAEKLRLFATVPVTLSAGVMPDAQHLEEGVAGFWELGVEPYERFEVALGVTNPPAFPWTLRYFVARGEQLELGVAARFAPFMRQFDGHLLPALGIGLVGGFGFDTVLGRFGLRLEPTVSRSLDEGGFTFPTALTVFWRV